MGSGIDPLPSTHTQAYEIFLWKRLEAKLCAWLCFARQTTDINQIPPAIQLVASLAVLYFGGDRSETLKGALQKLEDL